MTRARSVNTRSVMSRMPDTDFSTQSYRGYLIRSSPFSPHMWIEKDGHLIARVPPAKSWQWAREQIDQLPHDNPPRAGSRVTTYTGRKRYFAVEYVEHGDVVVAYGFSTAAKRDRWVELSTVRTPAAPGNRRSVIASALTQAQKEGAGFVE